MEKYRSFFCNGEVSDSNNIYSFFFLLSGPNADATPASASYPSQEQSVSTMNILSSVHSLDPLWTCHVTCIAYILHSCLYHVDLLNGWFIQMYVWIHLVPPAALFSLFFCLCPAVLEQMPPHTRAGFCTRFLPVKRGVKPRHSHLSSCSGCIRKASWDSLDCYVNKIERNLC